MKSILLSFCLFSIGSLWAQYEIGHTTITFTDPARSGRQIETDIYYPSDLAGDDVAFSSGSFPVVVFGHGFAMSMDPYENMWTEIVPQGFIMAFPRTEEGLFPAPSHEDFGLDLAFVVTEINNENTLSSSLLFEHVSDKSALMGHSMGGGATFLAAENNSSITTVIGLAPAETTPSAITATANISVPALIFSADQDLVTPAIDNHTPIYNGLMSSCKFFVNIIGGAHCYYANTSFTCDFGESTSGGNITITRAEQHATMFRYVIPWLKLYLYDDCDQHSVFETDLALDTEVTYLSTCSGFPVPTFDLNVTTSTNTLSSDDSGPLYQWINCDNGNSIIANETNQSYTPSQDGNYAVILGAGSCADTSNCYPISLVGIDELNNQNIKKELVMIVDLMGRVTNYQKNVPLIYIYSDGTRKRMMQID